MNSPTTTSQGLKGESEFNRLGRDCSHGIEETLLYAPSEMGHDLGLGLKLHQIQMELVAHTLSLDTLLYVRSDFEIMALRLLEKCGNRNLLLNPNRPTGMLAR